MNLKDLKNQLQNYRGALENVDQNRAAWDDAKKLILNTLNSIVSETQMKAEVDIEDKFEGVELVYLSLGKRESGIFERVGNAKRPYMKEGGYLFYAQIYNGKISVWYSLPTIESFIEQEAPKPVEIYSPSELSAEILIQHVTDFLKAMTIWEDKDLAHHEIGYKLRQQ